jgi:formylmethanofuran dehydrogenase subunit A
MKAKVDQAIEWIENAFNIIKDKEILTRSEKNVAARSVDFLATLYTAKRDKNRANQKLYDELDAKFKKYDELHDKYQ